MDIIRAFVIATVIIAVFTFAIQASLVITVLFFLYLFFYIVYDKWKQHVIERDKDRR